MLNKQALFWTFKKLFVKKNIQTQSLRFQSTKKYPEIIFSGIQPTGSVHLGNYLGAIRYWKKCQEENDNVIFSIVDLHSITLPQNPKELYNNILEMTATLLACGINPKKSILFQQSQIQQHTELCWLLGCLSTMARLSHLPQFKEKSASLKDVPLGLYIYPVLQAADILLYKATQIPVGEDQAQHLQLTQELARMFNNRFGETFPMPHAVMAANDLARLKSLRDPTKKMSKSDPDPKSRITLLDSPDNIVRNIKKAVTDFTSEVYYDLEKRPGVSNLMSIHSAITGKSFEQIANESEGINTGQYKLIVADVVVNHINPIRNEITKLLNDKSYIIQILEDGANRASEIAERTMQEVRPKLGLRFIEKRKLKQKLVN